MHPIQRSASNLSSASRTMAVPVSGIKRSRTIYQTYILLGLLCLYATKFGSNQAVVAWRMSQLPAVRRSPFNLEANDSQWRMVAVPSSQLPKFASSSTLIRMSSSPPDGPSRNPSSGDGKADSEDLADQVENALKVAEDALGTASAPTKSGNSARPSTSSAISKTKPMDPKRMATIRSESLAAAIGGVAVGAVVGVGVIIEFPEISVSVEPVVLPFASGLTLGTVSYVIGRGDNVVGSFIRTVLGKPTAAVGGLVVNSITSTITTTIDNIAATPGRVANAAQQQAQKAAATIQAIPGKIAESAKRTVEQTAEEIQAFPQRITERAADVAEEIVDEIKATPGRVADTAKQAVDQTVATTKQKIDQAVEDVKNLPQRTAEEVSSLLDGSNKSDVPRPPRVPPPKPLVDEMVQQQQRFIPEPPKIGTPKIKLPAISTLKPTPPEPIKISSPKIATPPLEDKAEAAAKAKQLEQAKDEELLNRQRQKKAAAVAAAERKEAERLRREEAAALAAEKRQREQEERAAAAEKRQKEQEAKAAERARLQQERAAAAEKRQKEQEAKAAERARQQQERAAAAEERRRKAASSGGGDSSGKAVSLSKSFSLLRPAPPVTEKGGPKLDKAPRGVPTITKWRRRRDGGVSGRIYGTSNFPDGDRIETSPIVKGTVDNGFVVTTDSGSRYFLSSTIPETTNEVQGLLSAIPGATIRLSQVAKQREADAAVAAAKEAKPRATFSLFGLLSNDDDGETDNNASSSKTASKKTAPRGVPTLKKWRKNRDGSITGLISGSPNFNEGERVTTSPIVQGKVEAGETVRTGSGSRYFLM